MYTIYGQQFSPKQLKLTINNNIYDFEWENPQLQSWEYVKNSPIISLLKRILSATVADWDKDNFEESKVKRSSNGQFASTGGANLTPQEIETKNISFTSEIMQDMRSSNKLIKSQVVYANPKAVDRTMYTNQIATVVDKSTTEKILKELPKYNNDDFSVSAEVNHRKDGNDGILITVYDKSQMKNYLEQATTVLMDGWFKDKVAEGQESKKVTKQSKLLHEQYLRETEWEKNLLKEFRQDKQYDHFVKSPNGRAERAFLLDEYLDMLKDKGITEQELALSYLFTVSPTSIRKGGSDPKEIAKPERKLCVQLADTLEKFIEKAPKWRGSTLYRGCHVKPDVYDKILHDNFVDMLGISSWSSDEYQAQAFADGSDNDEETIPVIFKLEETNHGTSVAAFSNYPYEQEVIVSNKPKYQITDINKNEDGYIYINLKEVETE